MTVGQEEFLLNMMIKSATTYDNNGELSMLLECNRRLINEEFLQQIAKKAPYLLFNETQLSKTHTCHNKLLVKVEVEFESDKDFLCLVDENSFMYLYKNGTNYNNYNSYPGLGLYEHQGGWITIKITMGE
ncbi:MAG: hypothetical protein ACYCR8_07990 [Cuniculiplasma sp.]